MTPQEVLMNCLADAERIDKIVIITYNKDECYEMWSNKLPSHERLGLLKIANIRTSKGIEISEEF